MVCVWMTVRRVGDLGWLMDDSAARHRNSGTWRLHSFLMTQDFSIYRLLFTLSIPNSKMAQTTKKQPKQDITGGDDLDDGLELDPDLLASSDNEDEDLLDRDADIGDEETRPEVDDDEGDEEPGADVGEKRKRDEGEDMDEEERKAEKKRRQKEKFKERKAKVSPSSWPSM